MLDRNRGTSIVVCAVGALLGVAPAVNADIIINVTNDCWIREAQPGNAYENDGILVDPIGDGESGGQRVGILEFDLSSITDPIMGAYIELVNRGGTFADTGAIQLGYSIPVPVSGLGGLTWNDYAANQLPLEVAFEGLGHYEVTGSQLPSGEYSPSAFATAADLTLLNTIRTSGNPKLGMSLKATAKNFYWDDQDPYDQLFPGHLVIVTGTVNPGTWNVDKSGDWSNAANWSGPLPNGVDKVAIFGGAITSTRTVYTDTAKTLGVMTLDNANTYVVAGGGSLTIEVSSGVGSVAVLQGSHKINLPLIFASNTSIGVAGGATLTIADPTTVKAGKTVTKSGSVLIEAPLTLEAGASLVLGGGASTLFGVPTMGAGAKVDVKNNSMSVDYRGLGSVASAVRAKLATGYNSGAWNGDGFNTSSATSATGLGWNDDAANQRVLVKYTYYGDSNLDGQVDITDLGNLATAWQSNGVWAAGDSDYSGFIDITDLGMLATNWQAGVGAPLSISFEQALAAVGLHGVAVPEPATIGVLGIGVMAIRRRRVK